MLLAEFDSEGGNVKHQYVGDINDYRKYALLRALSAGGANRIGVCWMLTPDDDSTDGNKLAYLNQPERFRHFDPELFDILVHAASEPDRRRLQTIEDSGTVAKAIYHNDMLPDDLSGRAAFMERCASQFRDAELVFFDPDNGLEVSLSKGRKNSSKYLYLDEVAGFYAAGKSLLVYQHFPRVERATFMAQRTTQLREAAPGCAVWAFTTSHVVFFLLVHPESLARLAVAALEACNLLDPSFVHGELMPWMPLRLASYDVIRARVAHLKEETMSNVHILAIDLAKRSFQICGTDRGGACVDAPDFARVFFRLLLQHVASIGRVSGL